MIFPLFINPPNMIIVYFNYELNLNLIKIINFKIVIICPYILITLELETSSYGGIDLLTPSCFRLGCFAESIDDGCER